MNLFDILSTLQAKVDKYKTEAKFMGEGDPNYNYWVGRQDAYQDVLDLLMPKGDEST